MARKTYLTGDRELLSDLGTFAQVRAVTDSTTSTVDDDGGLVVITKGSGATFTVAPEADIAWGEGSRIAVLQAGAGAITLTAGSGVTINKIATKTLVTGGASAMAFLARTGTNTWVAWGDLAAV